MNENELLFQVLQPLFRFSNNIVEDALKNKIIEEALEMIQDIMKAIVDCLTKINQPEGERSFTDHFLHFLKEWYQYFFKTEIKKKRLIKDLLRNLTQCQFD